MLAEPKNYLPGKGNLSNLDQNYPTLCFMIPHEKAGPAWFMSKIKSNFLPRNYKRLSKAFHLVKI